MKSRCDGEVGLKDALPNFLVEGRIFKDGAVSCEYRSFIIPNLRGDFFFQSLQIANSPVVRSFVTSPLRLKFAGVKFLRVGPNEDLFDEIRRSDRYPR